MFNKKHFAKAQVELEGKIQNVLVWKVDTKNNAVGITIELGFGKTFDIVSSEKNNTPKLSDLSNIEFI